MNAAPPPTPYPALNTVLDELVRSIQAVLGENFTGAYLQGSFAVGDFDEHSDVDFIMVVKADFGQETALALQAIHQRLYDQYPPWGQHLEGSYFPAAILGDAARSGEPVWYIDHGSRYFERSDHCNTIVVRSTLREFGVTLAGPPPTRLIDPVPVDALRRDIYHTIIEWGQEILDTPDRFNNRFYQTYLVLNYCRMLRDLRRGVPGSKRAGAAWAKANLDPAWHGLIDRTWAGRPDPAASVRQPADPDDFAATLDFIRCVMQQSRDYAGSIGLA